jgi:Na+/melibiose symporter-like transporter
MNDKSRSKLATGTTRSLLQELDACFCGTVAILVSGFIEARQWGFRLLVTAVALLLVIFLYLRFLRVLRELKRRDEQNNSNNSPAN